ncbi:MAG TPA: hypothetical protein VLA28_10115 [Afifellaceae bacterium]|nr:hypothetical protein [Afifellaceae bacterium]
MAGKRLPLPRRFNAALTEKAYIRLRALNARYGLSNNYLLTVLLERLDDYVDEKKLAAAFDAFIAEFGAPETAKPMKPADR